GCPTTSSTSRSGPCWASCSRTTSRSPTPSATASARTTCRSTRRSRTSDTRHPGPTRTPTARRTRVRQVLRPDPRPTGGDMQHRATRIALVGTLAVALFVAAGLGPFRRADPGAPPTAAPGSETLLQPVLSGSLDRIISSLQQRLRVLPDDYRSFASLGLAYVQQARLTADPSYYPKAEGVLQRSLSLDTRDNYAAMVGMAALAAARHDFATALAWGERAKEINSANGNVYGVIGDAQVELGRYPQAYASFQKMVDTLPGLSSYSRVSYARELQGNVPGAIASMQAAFDVTGSPADQAWASNQLGDLEFNH